MPLAELFLDHLDARQAYAEKAMAAHGFDSLIISSGTPFTYFADDQVVDQSGELHCYDLGGGRQQRWFCATCGTTLFWKIAARAGETGIAGGCFDGPLPPPNRSVVNEGRPAWLCTNIQDGGA